MDVNKKLSLDLAASLSKSKEKEQDWFNPECQVVMEGGPDCKLLFETCKKNPGHDNFIPVHQFGMEHLPRDLQNIENLEDIQRWADRTVKLIISATSPNRPDVYPNTSIPFPYRKGRDHSLRCGTGFITNVETKKCVDKQCPCYKCVKSGQLRKEYCEVTVRTAAHVVYDELEARSCVIECFYDSEDRESVKQLFGISAVSSAFRDVSTMICTTHDKEIIAGLQNLSFPRRIHYGTCIVNWAVVISHPHGRCKHIALGEYDRACRIKEQVEEDVFHLPFQTWKGIENTEHQITVVSHSQDQSNKTSLGRRWTLPKGTKWRFPPKSDLDQRRIIDFRQPISWRLSVLPLKCLLPARSEYQLPNGTVREFPPDCVIEVPTRVRSLYQRLMYNISTCPGSSGAPVLLFHQPHTKPHVEYSNLKFCHSGAFRDGSNRSCLQMTRPFVISISHVANLTNFFVTMFKIFALLLIHYLNPFTEFPLNMWEALLSTPIPSSEDLDLEPPLNAEDVLRSLCNTGTMWSPKILLPFQRITQ